MRYNLSEITDIIKDRRSIKPEAFSARKVHKEIITNVLNNALWAPTHGMTQPWRFKVFTGEARKRLGDFSAENYRANTAAADFKEAKFEKFKGRPLLSSVVIAICMERQPTGKIPEVEEVAAVACAVQNIHLSCTAYGLGGYWTTGGGTYTEGMRQFLGLQEKDRCLGFFYIGYPEGEWPKGQRRPLEYAVEWLEE